MVSEPTILEQIVARKTEEVAAAQLLTPFSELETRLQSAAPTRGFGDALRARTDRKQAAIIAEIKKASPSRGLIREDFDPVQHARDYAQHGATCLSVLTDRDYFQGDNVYLQQARDACTLPVIRKDFMIDRYQIAESRLLGADCILLIVAALGEAQLQQLAAYANSLAIDVLVEVHNEEELSRALELDTDLIGINNRNLHTFETSLHTTLSLAKAIPQDKLVISESGFNSRADVETMLDAGIYGFLIGETFMRAPQPGVKLQELFPLE